MLNYVTFSAQKTVIGGFTKSISVKRLRADVRENSFWTWKPHSTHCDLGSVNLVAAHIIWYIL